MIKVVAKFKEKFWDKEANAEIPMDTIYMGEALSVESQKDGMNVQQKFNGHNNGIFLKYKDMSVLQLDDATIDDFKDLDALETACNTANATKKITFVGVNFKVSQSAETDPTTPADIDITSCFKKDGKVEDKVIFLEADKDYEIREVSVENAEVSIKRVEVITPAHDGLPATSEFMIQATVHGMQGNVVMTVVTAEVPKEPVADEGTSGVNTGNEETTGGNTGNESTSGGTTGSEETTNETTGTEETTGETTGSEETNP